MSECTLTSVGPIDGRYSGKTFILHRYFSEFALIHYRLQVEVKWLISLGNNDDIKDIPTISQESKNFLIGPEHEAWDAILLVEHESVEKFIAFSQNKDYLKNAGHRTAALEDSRLLPITEKE